MTESVRFCPFCGTQLTPGAAFCQSCGKPVSQRNIVPDAPKATSSLNGANAWTWFKGRSIKGKAFYAFWVLTNVIGLVEIAALFAPDDTLQTGCGAKFTMRSFLDGTSEPCGPTQSQQVSGEFMSLLLQNIIFLATLFIYKRVSSVTAIKSYAITSALAVGLGVSFYQAAYTDFTNEVSQDLVRSILTGTGLILTGTAPLILRKLKRI